MLARRPAGHKDRPLEATVRLGWQVDPVLTLLPLWQGPGDPQMRIEGRVVVRAAWTQAGPATLRLELGSGAVRVQAWGAGAGAAIDRLPQLLGADDEPDLLQPRHALVAELVRRHAGLRMVRGGGVMAALLPAIIAQKVTGLEARRSYRALVARMGVPAPGPLGLRLAPMLAELAGHPYWAFHELGLERRRADALRHAAGVADRLEEIAGLPAIEAQRRLLAVRGIGPWTAAETMRVALGDPDAVSVGDYNIPNLVGWALAREARSDDARMLELLEPYHGQRARVVRLLELSGLRPPRYGPRLAPRSIRAI